MSVIDGSIKAGMGGFNPVKGNVKKAAPKQKLPVQADKFESSPPGHTWVKGADVSTYKKVFGAMGAATGAFASHIALLGSFGAVGSAIGGIAGAMIAGPVGAVAGKVIGGAVGTVAGGYVQAKTMAGRKVGGRLGAIAGKAMALVAKALKIPLRSDHIEDTKNFDYDKMKTRLGDINYTSHPTISEKDAEKFVSQLKPGDMVVTNDEACTIFSLIIVAANGKADYNHAILYQGDGKTIESRTVTDGVAEGDLKEVLSHKHHAVAIRPHYEDGQGKKVVEAGRGMIGTKYDFRFRMGDNSMYCSEVVYKAVKSGAPQVGFKTRPMITREVVLPGDLLRTSQADVVAEVGRDSTLFNSYMAKFA